MSEVAKRKLHSILRLEVSKTKYQTLESQILGLRTMAVIFGCLDFIFVFDDVCSQVGDKSSRIFPLAHDLTCIYIYIYIYFFFFFFLFHAEI